MIRPRVIPCLLLKGGGLVKTVKFREPKYLGDPINIVRLFNDKEVDELVILDITATPEQRGPNYEQLRALTSECFMPLAYGGGIRTMADVQALLNIGIEKVILNTSAVERPALIREAADYAGNQAVVVSIDVKKDRLGRAEVFTHGGRIGTGLDPTAHAKSVEAAGAGEILLNSVDRDGTMRGYDIPLTRRLTEALRIPVVACGGAGELQDIADVIRLGGASAAAAGSLFVFHGPLRAVLISYPSREDLRAILEI
jgi:cyclase